MFPLLLCQARSAICGLARPSAQHREERHRHSEKSDGHKTELAKDEDCQGSGRADVDRWTSEELVGLYDDEGDDEERSRFIGGPAPRLGVRMSHGAREQ